MSRYHITLNGQGYILADQGRMMRPLPPFTPRFSTGDPTAGDFTYWQFWQMKDFRGGSGQEYYGDETKYYTSLGIDPRKEKELTLLPKMRQIAKLPPDEWKLLEYNGQLYAFGRTTGNMVSWTETVTRRTSSRSGSIFGAIIGGLIGGLFGGAGWLIGAGIGAFIGGVASHEQTTNTYYKVKGIESFCVAGDLLIIGTNDGYLVSLRGTATERAKSLKSLNTKPIFSTATGGPITAMTAFEEGIIYAQGGRIYYLPIKLDGSFDTEKKLEIGAVAGITIKYFALWNQKVYFGGYNTANISVIGWTDGRRLQGTYTIPGRFQLWGMKPYFGYLIYVGGRPNNEEPIITAPVQLASGDQTGRSSPIKINNPGYIGEVYIYPNDLLFQLKDQNGYDSTIYDITASSDLIVPWSHGMGCYHIMPNKGYWPGSYVPVSPNPNNIITGIEEFAGNTIFITIDGRVYQTLLGRYIDKGEIELSCYQAGVDLVEKIWRDIFVYTKFPLDPGQKIEMFAKPVCTQPWEKVGEMTKSQSKGYGIIGFTSPSLYLKFRFSTTNERLKPTMEQIVVRYVPGAVKKRSWGLQIKAENSLKLLDGSYEKRSGQEIANDIWTAYLLNTPVSFTDIDGMTYGVLVTDIEEETPAINKDRLEHIIRVELLEA